MRRSRTFRRTGTGLAVAAALAMMGMPVAQGAEEAAKEGGNWAGTDDFSFQLSGYARAWASFNLEDQPELSAVGKDSAGKLSMLSGSVLLDADAKTGPVKWKVIGRLDREYKTNYLEDLEDLRATNGTAGGKSITENYNNDDIREFWEEIPIGDRITVKAGKQQLVWGESDFFQAMDLVHGYDYSWRLFFEGENEEWRNPTGIARTARGGLFVLDAGLRPFTPSAINPFIGSDAEPAIVHEVDLASGKLTAVSEPGQLVYPTVMTAAGDRLLICDPGQPEVAGLQPFWSRVRPFVFDVVVHFTESRLLTDSARQMVLRQTIGTVRSIIEAQKPAHTVWNLVTSI